MTNFMNGVIQGQFESKNPAILYKGLHVTYHCHLHILVCWVEKQLRWFRIVSMYQSFTSKQNGWCDWKLFQVWGLHSGQISASRSESECVYNHKVFIQKEVSVCCNKFKDGQKALNDGPQKHRAMTSHFSPYSGLVEKVKVGKSAASIT